MLGLYLTAAVFLSIFGRLNEFQNKNWPNLFFSIESYDTASPLQKIFTAIYISLVGSGNGNFTGGIPLSGCRIDKV
jgi:hypothetical protein